MLYVNMEGPVGFEPTTRGLKGRCSNQAELWALVKAYAFTFRFGAGTKAQFQATLFLSVFQSLESAKPTRL